MNELIRTPAVIAGEINLIKEQVRSTALQASIEIGRRLTEVQNLVPRGEWTQWLAENVDYSIRTAQNLMALAAECDAGRGASLEKFPYSKAVLLLSVPEDERDEFVADHDVDQMSVRELKAELDQLKEKNNELQISMDELLADQSSNESAADAMQAEIADLKTKLAQANDAVKQAKEMSAGMQQQSRETADKLRKDLKAARDETAHVKAQAETEKKQLEKALKDAKQPVIQQVTPPDVEKELQELRTKLNRNQDEQALRACYELLRSSFQRLMESLSDLDARDAQIARQYRGAFAKGLQIMAEELTKGDAAA